jgi:hypothetical protein
VLKAMKRPANQEKVLDRLASWRKICPDIAIRSTFIVGFPGETDADFEYLLQWMRQARIERAGCFKYEPVSGAKANDLGLPLYDAGTGGCHDGLHESRLNQNQGAESTLSFLLALAEMKALDNASAAFSERPT